MSNQENKDQYKITVVAAVIDVHRLTLYKEDGSTVEIKQGDPRVATIVAHITPYVLRKEKVVVDLSDNVETNVYSEYEKKSGGIVKFFRVAKAKLAKFFSSEESETVVNPPELAPAILGEVPTAPIESVAEAAEQNIQSAVADIMANAKPATDPTFNDHDLKRTDETVVAVVGDKIVAGVEALKPQLNNANNTGNSKGMDLFMQRMAAVSDKRRHSVDDLLKFMSRGDLPIADDGSIIIYKILKQRPGHYVDCHSQNVTQKIGSYVCMDENMVDPDRRNDCSNGLHVARRQYLGNFSGDVCVLAKVAPEDVIAVPQYDANKMRVCGYHILFELDSETYYDLRHNKSFQPGSKGANMLANAMIGNHVQKLEEVRIMSSMGGNLKITPLVNGKLAAPELQKTLSATPIEVSANDKEAPPVKAPAVDPVQVSKAIEATRPAAESVKAAEPVAAPASVVPTKKPTSRNEIAASYVEGINSGVESVATSAAQSLYELKKKAKVSWTALGIDSATIDRMGVLLGKETKAQPEPTKDLNWKAPTPVTKKATKPKLAKVKASTKKPAKPAKAPVKKVTKTQEDRTQGKRSYADRIAILLPVTSVGAADAVWELKKKAKKSLEALGVAAKDQEEVEFFRTKK